ncbi:phospholipase B-like 1 [Liolophura sinensis]|uniref:phospholipase B-like 1 n=1 Tax=Liolophura sinensis TaxID=3198878 RepID=UPI0031584604
MNVYLLFLFFSICFRSAKAWGVSGSVYCSSRMCTYKEGKVDVKGSTATGSYDDRLLETGWGILNVNAGNGRPSTNDDIMFGAGYLEGTMTAARIYQHYINLRSALLGTVSADTIAKLKKFLDAQDEWMRVMIKKHGHSDPLWRHVSYVLAQFDGLVAGYRDNALKNQSLDVFAFQVLNGNGDLLDLLRVVDLSRRPIFSKMTKTELKDYVLKNSRCSALVKVLPGYENVFMSHSSWFLYSATMRIYKHYDLNVADPATSAKKMSFSSYPGFLESLDDFYILGSKMVMLQTTNNVFNTTLYNYVQPESLLAWHRVRVASMMAATGKQWAETVAQYNSGTYNNQYMVIDLKQIELNKTLHDNALWVVEQIPTLVAAADKTDVLRTGYWPSYNVPFFEDVYNLSGYPDIVAEKGVDMSYQLAPRAKIFRRDADKVVDMETMKRIMRYNDFKHDKYSENVACDTICCRGDLLGQPEPLGCYDTKVTDFWNALMFSADIINGPTLGTDLPPFRWSEFANASHIGLPPVYNFSFINTKPKNMV